MALIGKPKRPMNSYMLFARTRRPKLCSEHPHMRIGDIAKALSQEWKALSPAEKQFFVEKAKIVKDSFHKVRP